MGRISKSCLFVTSAGAFFVLSTYFWTINIHESGKITFPANQVLIERFADNATISLLFSGKKVQSPRAVSQSTATLLKSILTNRLTDNYTYCNDILPFSGPYNYTIKSQNPCWMDEDGIFRCLPYFHLAGFSKSGTTDIFFRIQKHPFVFNFQKEKHWLDYLRYFKHHGFIQNYTNMFTLEANATYALIKRSGYSKMITGDGTPCNVWFSLYWRCFEGNEDADEPRYSNADIVYRLYPKTKIIILVREPVTRLYSRFLTWVYRVPLAAYQNPSPESFHTIATEAVLKYKQCFQQWSPRHCAYNGTLYSDTGLRLQEGMYSVFLKDWLKVFPRNQVLILRFEDYIQDIRNILVKVFSFLELTPVSANSMNKIVKIKPKNVGRHYNIGPMLNKTRQILEDFYRPFVQELADLLMDKRFLWHYNQV